MIEVEVRVSRPKIRFDPKATSAVTKAIQNLYDLPYPTWSDFPYDLRQTMFNEFKEEKNGGKLPFGKLFKETHTKKRKPGESEDEPVWGEPRAGATHEAYSQIMEEYIQTKGCNEQGEPYKPTDEEEIGVWLEVCGGVHKGRAYGLSSERSFHRLDSGLRGIGSSSYVEALDRGMFESMQRKIAMLNEELQATAAAREADRVEREAERVRLDDEMTSLKSQMKHFVRNVLPHTDKSDED